ncbi:hypothetical protein WSM22_39230 [Cytophagales bacterium WSM2-2]|nr:hypothetical protein WSM22_39230 [Cytophagales bacterium WSM2-2]
MNLLKHTLWVVVLAVQIQQSRAQLALVKDANSSATGSFNGESLKIGSFMYFSASDGTNGIELWRTDGTTGGTAMVKDINTSSAGASSLPGNFVNVNGTVYFTANDGTNGVELWRSDGTAMGTVMVANINTAAASSSPTNLTAIGTKLYFSATTATNGTELYVWDGMVATLVKDIKTTPTPASSSGPSNLVNVNGTLFFTADDGNVGIELWKSDGTTGGTVLVKNIDGASTSSSLANLTAVGSTLFFSAATAASGVELYKSDGTDPGTVKVTDINLTIGGAGSSSPSFLTNVNGTLFFFAVESGSAFTLWKSDGTGPGTVKLNANAFTTLGVATFNNIFYFVAEKSVGGSVFEIQLWRSDGTNTNAISVLSTTYSFKDQVSFAAASNNTFYFVSSNGTGSDLYVSDGTTTYSLVSNLGRPSAITLMTTIGRTVVNFVSSKILFWNDDGVVGTELYSYTPVSKLKSSMSSNNFGSVALSSTASVDGVFTNTGLGTSTINLGSITLTGANPADFTFVTKVPTGLTPESNCNDGIDNDGDGMIDCADSGCGGAAACAGTIAPGATLLFTATLTPSATGARAATVSVPSNDLNSPFTLALSGTGIKINQTITFNTPAARRLGSVATFDLDATASSGLTVTYQSSNSAVATVSGATVTLVGVGTSTITAQQAGNASYNAATDVLRTLTIQKPLITATADAKSKTYRDANPALTITYTGFLNGDTPSVIDTPPTASTTATTASDVGGYPITLTGGADAVYDLTLIAGNLSVTKANLTVTGSNHSKVYGTANPNPTLSYSGFLNSETTSVLDVLPTVSLNTSDQSNVGTYSVFVNGGSDNNYNIVRVNGQLTITKASVTAKASDRTKIYGNTNPTFPITYTGLLFGQSSNVIDVAPSVPATITDLSNAGTYPLTLSGGSDNNYDITFDPTPGTLTITKASLAVYADPKTKVYGENNPTLTFTYDNTYFKGTDGPSVIDTPPTIATTATQTSNVGNYPITLTGGSDNNYTLISLTSNILEITKAAQQIVTASSIQDIVMNTAFDLIAISTGGDQAQVQLDKTAGQGQIGSFYTTITLPQGTQKGYRITGTAPGKVTLRLSQAGTLNYNAATSVTIPAFCILPLKPFITNTLSSNSEHPVLTSSSNVGNQWYRNGTAIGGATSSTFQITEPGIYKVQVSVEGCTGPVSDEVPVAVTGIAEASQEVSVYPNPVHDALHVSGIQLDQNWGIVDAMGRSERPPVQRNEESSVVDTRNLAPGLYILKANQAQKNIIIKFIKD